MRSPRTTCRFLLFISGLTSAAVQDCVVEPAGTVRSPLELHERLSEQESEGPRVRAFPLISDAVCADIIRVALESAATQGWTTNRHKKYPTTDLDVKSIPSLWEVVGPHIEQLERSLSLSKEYGAAIEFHDVFLVRYAENGQRALDLHEDGSRVTFQVALNTAREDFQDGGTWFEAMACRLQPNLGHAMTFHGGLKHAGLAISSGERYVLVGFSQFPNSEDDQNMHVSFGGSYDVILGDPAGGPAGFAGPCLEMAHPVSTLLASVAWHGCPDDVFAVSSSIRDTVRWLWLSRESGQQCNSEASHQRDLRLSYETSPDEGNLFSLLQLPPGHDYEAIPLKRCSMPDVFEFFNVSGFV